MPGAPQIYNGDEAGMWGGDDPDCRKPNVWPDIEYEPESTHPFNKPRTVDEVKFDQSMFDWIKKLASIRAANKALSLGDIKFEIVDNDNNILAFKRHWQSQEFIILINRNSSAYKLDLKKIKLISDKKEMKELISGTVINQVNSNLELLPYQIMILK
jgi:glycosidase